MSKKTKPGRQWDEPPPNWDPEASYGIQNAPIEVQEAPPPPFSTPDEPRVRIETAPEVDALTQAESMLRAMLSLVEQSLAAGDLDPDVAKQAPNIARAVAAVAGERRQLAKQALKEASRIGVPQVLAFLRQLPSEKRANVMRELEAMDQGRSVLS